MKGLLSQPPSCFLSSVSSTASSSSKLLYQCQCRPPVSHLLDGRQAILEWRWRDVVRERLATTSSLAAQRPPTSEERPKASSKWSVFLGLMTIYSAILGPFLDGYHGSFKVLIYDAYEVNVDLGGKHILSTATWVPFVFGLAGIIMGGLTVLGDKVFDTALEKRQPSWPQVLAAISLFSFQYYLSGALAAGGLDSDVLFVLLSGLAVMEYIIFDTSVVSIAVGLLTAVCGPAIEIFLVNFTQLYHYSEPNVYGIPSWIAPVYFAGGPAVNNLARRTWMALAAKEEKGRGEM